MLDPLLMLKASDLAAIAMAVLLSVCRSLQLKCRSLALTMPLVAILLLAALTCSVTQELTGAQGAHE